MLIFRKPQFLFWHSWIYRVYFLYILRCRNIWIMVLKIIISHRCARKNRQRKKKSERDRENDFELNCGNGQYNFIAEVDRSFVYSRIIYRGFVNYMLPSYLTTRKPSRRRSTFSNGKNLGIRLPGGFKQSQKSWVDRDSPLLSSWPDLFLPARSTAFRLFVLSDNLLDFL